MSTYRTRVAAPVVVQARQYTDPAGADELAAWVEAHAGDMSGAIAYTGTRHGHTQPPWQLHTCITVHGPRGESTAYEPGHWIVIFPDGHAEAFSPEDFTAQFEEQQARPDTPSAEVMIAALTALTRDLHAAAQRNMTATAAVSAAYARDLTRAQTQFETATGQRPMLTLPQTVEPRLVIQQGIWLARVWVPYHMLADLASGVPVDSTSEQDKVLLEYGLAARAPHAGLVKGTTLDGYLGQLQWADPRGGDLQ